MKKLIFIALATGVCLMLRGQAFFEPSDTRGITNLYPKKEKLYFWYSRSAERQAKKREKKQGNGSHLVTDVNGYRFTDITHVPDARQLCGRHARLVYTYTSGDPVTIGRRIFKIKPKRHFLKRKKKALFEEQIRTFGDSNMYA